MVCSLLIHRQEKSKREHSRNNSDPKRVPGSKISDHRPPERFPARPHGPLERKSDDVFPDGQSELDVDDGRVGLEIDQFVVQSFGVHGV